MRSLLAPLFAAFALAAPLGAQPVANHLKCYKVKDPLTKAKYTADLGGLVAEPGCVIKVPAVMACVPATKKNVRPPPPESAGGTGAPNAFGCYKVKCPSATLPALPLSDQFGARIVTPSAPKLVCAPAAPPFFPPCGPAGTSCGSCAPTPGGVSNECLPLCARGCADACVTVFPTVGCTADADCPFGQACVATIIPQCQFSGCGSISQGNCAAPCP
jgi:hypothetical protein